LDFVDSQVYQFFVVCSGHALTKRLEMDIAAGIRTLDVIARSIARLKNYSSMDTIQIETSDISAKQAAEKRLYLMNVC